MGRCAGVSSGRWKVLLMDWEDERRRIAGNVGNTSYLLVEMSSGLWRVYIGGLLRAVTGTQERSLELASRFGKLS